MNIRNFIQVDRIDYKGREFAEFRASRNHAGRGYVVIGECTDPTQYGWTLIKTCATLIKTYKDGRAFPVGFQRERDAHQFALYLNGTDAGTIV